ncbi:MAG TPA: hypothetical protein VGE07_05910 [Herpetosiphonaceae bacterium]
MTNITQPKTFAEVRAELHARTPAEQQAQNAQAIVELERWLADDSGYDEATWPLVERLIAENRLSERDHDA